MKFVPLLGSIIVTLALIIYTVGFIKVQKLKEISFNILLLFTFGVISDIIATFLMMLASSKGILTFHGFIGFTSLFGMIAFTVTIWKFHLKQKSTFEVTKKLNLFCRIVYIWWVISYFTGAILAMVSNK